MIIMTIIMNDTQRGTGYWTDNHSDACRQALEKIMLQNYDDDDDHHDHHFCYDHCHPDNHHDHDNCQASECESLCVIIIIIIIIIIFVTVGPVHV